MTTTDPVRSLTAAVCTHGQAPHLLRALTSLAEQRWPAAATLEILCVDNNARPRVSLPDDLAARVRVIHEPTPGLSRARNAAVERTESDAVAFIDDDAVAAPGWAAALARAFEQTGAWCVGGRVLPEWPEGKSARPHPGLHYLLSLLDLGDDVQTLRGPVFPCGANLAIRRFAFERVGRFRTSLGRRPDSLLSGEETEFLRRVQRAGGTIAYAPDAVVHHIVPASRLDAAYLRNRAWWEGKTMAILDRLDRGALYAAGTAALRTGLALLREPITLLSAAGSSSRRMLAVCRLHKTAGYWAGLFTPLGDGGQSRATGPRRR